MSKTQIFFQSKDLLTQACIFLHTREQLCVRATSKTFDAAVCKTFGMVHEYNLAEWVSVQPRHIHQQKFLKCTPSPSQIACLGRLIFMGPLKELTLPSDVDAGFLRNFFQLETSTKKPDLRELQHFGISCGDIECGQLLAEDLIPLLYNARNLRSLDLDGCFAITNFDLSLQLLEKFVDLERLNLYAGGIQDGRLVQLVKCMPKLRELELGYCEVLTSAGVSSLLSTAGSRLERLGLHKTVDGSLETATLLQLGLCDRLKSLDLSSQYHVTDAVLEALPPALESVSLSYFGREVSNFSPQALHRMSRRLPLLRAINLQGSSPTVQGVLEASDWTSDGWTLQRSRWNTKLERCDLPQQSR